ncbi:MAG: efflux RND transporter permease subunit [Rhodobacteraceae bacterium]|nr:efflux RND transporter permease subunit [Paracoccaceae bacterium]
MRTTPDRTRSIPGYFIRHRTAAHLLLVIMVILGVTSATQIRTQFFPDVILDSVTVSIRWEGAGPEDVDNAVVSVIEPPLLGVEGVKGTYSTATEGRARIRLDFEANWDMGRATEDVMAAVDLVTGLPEGIEEPKVYRNAWRDRVTDVVISGPVSVAQLSRFADEFSARLFREGVTRTTIRGVSAPEIFIDVPELSLIRHDITLREIAAAIGEEAEADPAGALAGGTGRVRTGIEKRTAEDVEEIVVRSNPDGSRLRVRDVGRVVTKGASYNRAYYVGEHPAVSIRVDRSTRSDAIRLQHRVEEVAADMQATLPDSVAIELIRTRAEYITDRLDILIDNGALGLLLVVGLLFMFLNARTAFWVAAGIPVAMFAAIAMMYAFGLTLNMISLFGLIITLGIVVDDAIVVGEHADFRVRQLGESPVQAAENAAIRMAPPVFSATVTTVIAFFGITAVGGRFGELIGDIPFTVIVVLLASLMECFIILPNHMCHALRNVHDKSWYDVPSMLFNRGFDWFRRVVFRRFISLVLFFRYPVIAGMVLLLATQAALFLSGDVRWRFFNAPERSSISGNFAMLSGATREDTLAMMRELQRAVDTVARHYEQEYGRNPVIHVLAEVGGNTGRALAQSDTKDKELLGSIAIELIDRDDRPYPSFVLLASIQEEVRNHPMVEVLSFRGWRTGPGGDALDVQIYGATPDVLKAASEALQGALSRYPEISAVEDTMAYDKEELVLELTPQGQALGFTIDRIGDELRSRLNGIEAARFPVGLRTGKITVRLPQEELTADFLDRTRLRAPGGAYVPLADIVTVSTDIGFSMVRRENGLPLISVTGDIAEDDPVRADEIRTELQQAILPGIAADMGIEWQLGGLAAQEQDFMNDVLLGFALCLFGIFLTLTWIFASWTRPLVVMAVIPFGLIGAIFGHWHWDIPLSMFSVIGFVGMSGIIINDSIVLVSTVDEYSRSRGLYPALVDAAADRFRPVLLTTLTTVLGLLPLMFEQSRQAEFLKPTIITLCYGLALGMVLVLLVVPSLLIVQQDVGRLWHSFRRSMFGRHRAPGLRTVIGLALVASFFLFMATVGSMVWTGEAPAWLPASATGVAGRDVPASVATFATLAVGSLGIVLIALVLGTVVRPGTGAPVSAPR